MINSFNSTIILLVLNFVHQTEAKLVLLMAETFEDCTKGGAKFIDYSGIEFDYVNDTSYVLTGSF